MAVLHEKNIAMTLLVTWIITTCISINGVHVLAEPSTKSFIYVDETLLDCIPQELKNFSRRVENNKELVRVTDEGYFIPLVTGSYSFRVHGRAPKPFLKIELWNSQMRFPSKSSEDGKWYTVEFYGINLTKGQIFQISFRYDQHVRYAIPISFSFDSGGNWTSIWDQLVRRDSGESNKEHKFVGEWSSWTPCNKTCGELGKKSRKRLCAEKPFALNLQINYTCPSLLNEDKSCLANTSCSGVLYTLAPPRAICSPFCQKQNRLCALEGHDFPKSSAFLIFEALGKVCKTTEKTEYDNGKVVRISKEGLCRGYENIPDTFSCKSDEMSDTDNVVCPCAPLPVPPTNVSVEQLNATAINVSVNYSPDNPRLKYYRTIGIELIDSQRKRIAVRSKAYSINAWMIFNGLGRHDTYCIQTRSKDGNGEGFPSSCYNFTMHNVPLSAPPNVNATGDTRTAIYAQWDDLDLQLNGQLIKYSVYVLLGGNISTSVNTTDQNVTIGGLQIFTKYCVQVSAWTMSGEGPLSHCKKAITLQGVPLSAPRSFAIGYVMAELVNLVWEHVLPDRNHDTLVGYRVYYIECNRFGLTAYQETMYGSGRTANITSWIKPFTCYYFKLTGFTNAGEGNYTEWINTTTKEGAPTAAPGGLSYQELSNSSVNISWQSLPSNHANGVIRGYSICQSINSYSSACNERITTCSDVLHKVVRNLTVGKNHCFKLKAFTAVGASPSSDCLDVLIEMAPNGFPQNISATNTSSTSFNIAWEQVDTDLQNGIIKGYQIFWKELAANNTNSMTVNDTIQSLEVTMLKTFTTYCVQIQAYTSKGNGPMSPCVHVTTDEGVPSVAPTDILVQRTTSRTITISYSPIPNEHANGFLLGYSLYVLYKCEQNPNKEEAYTLDFASNITVVKVYLLAPNKCHSLSVSGYTRIGEGNISEWVNATTLDEAPSGIPQDISARNTGSTSFIVTWNEIDQDKQNGQILGYRLFYTGYSGERSNLSKTTNASILSLEVTMVERYSSYCVQVLGFNRKGNGPLSPCVNVTTDEALPSRAPEVLSINTTAKSMKVVWKTLPEEYHHGVLLGYKIFRKRFSLNHYRIGRYIVPANVTKKSLIAKPNTLYLCQMCAYNRIGDGVRSEWRNCSTPEGVPDESPQGITAHGHKTAINVTWGEVPASQRNGVILGYRIFWKDSLNQTNGTQTVNNDTFSLDIKGLKIYTSYCVQVLAFTKAGDGNISACVDVRTDEDVPTRSPSSLVGRSLTSTSLEISWEAPPMNTRNGKLLGYVISIHRFNQALQMIDTPVSLTLTCPHNTSKVIEYLNIGLLYCVKVAVFNKIGVGNFSNCSMVKLKEEVPSRPPRKIQIVDRTATSLLVSWSSIYWARRNGIILGYTLIIKPYTTITAETTATTTTTNPPTTTLLHSNLLRSVRVRRSVSSEMVINVGPDVQSYLVTNLDKNTEYCVQLLGFNSAGEGNQSDCVLSRTFATDNVIPQLTLRTGSTSIQVNLNISGFNELVSSGFLMHYEVQYKIRAVSGIPVEEGEFKSRFFNATTQTIVLDGLSQYTSYVFQAAVITKSGRGNFSHPVIIETCHCPDIFYTNWYVNAPFTKLKSNEISGILPSILNDVMRTACKYCDLNNGSAMIDYYNDHHGDRVSMKDDVNAMKGNITSYNHISFPLTQRNKELKYEGTYVPLLYVPGLLVIGSNESLVEKYARVVAGSVYDIWPVIIINIVTTLLAGTIIWLLERGSNSEQFPVSTIKGIGEGSWWAFITMTTLGYGDRVPVTRAGRIFAIIWSLVGISIASIMIGSLCATFTVTVVEEYGTGIEKGITVGVVALTPDAEIAEEVCRGRATVKSFQSIEELVTAQRSGEVDNMIVDHFTAQNRLDLFNGTWYKIRNVINQPFTYGVLLKEEATKLERYFKEYSAVNVSKVVEFANMVDKSEEANETEPVRLTVQTETINFLDPSSSIFGTTFLVLGLTLFFFFLCGFVYDKLVTKKRDKKDSELVDDYRERLEAMRSHLLEFYSNVCALNSQLRTHHNDALRRLLVQEKKKKPQNSVMPHVNVVKVWS